MDLPVGGRDPLSTGILTKPLNRVLASLKIQRRLTTHGLRRTFNSLALQVAPAETVRKVIGHADSAMTLHYLHVDTEQRRQLGEGVFGKVLPPEVEAKWKIEVASNERSEREEKNRSGLN